MCLHACCLGTTVSLVSSCGKRIQSCLCQRSTFHPGAFLLPKARKCWFHSASPIMYGSVIRRVWCAEAPPSHTPALMLASAKPSSVMVRYGCTRCQAAEASRFRQAEKHLGLQSRFLLHKTAECMTSTTEAGQLLEATDLRAGAAHHYGGGGRSYL